MIRRTDRTARLVVYILISLNSKPLNGVTSTITLFARKCFAHSFLSPNAILNYFHELIFVDLSLPPLPLPHKKLVSRQHINKKEKLIESIHSRKNEEKYY